MAKTRAAITAVGAYLPTSVLDNKTLEQMVDTNDEWIVSRTGIKERRILKEPGRATAYMAIQAAQNLLEKTRLSAEDIELIIVATATADMPVVATAAQVITALGAKTPLATIYRPLVLDFYTDCLPPRPISRVAATKKCY